MRKYAVSNLLFTVSFLLIISPLLFLLFNYVINYGMPTVAAKKTLSDLNLTPLSINRDFSNTLISSNKVTVLMYHQIIPEEHLKTHHFKETGELEDMILTLEDFTEQMNYLKKENYTVLTLKEFEHFMVNQKKVPAKSVLITFDDGYKNVFEFAYPVLKRHGFYATHFMITSLITNKTVAYDSSFLQYASIEELKDASDVFDYGNHTNSYHQRTKDGVSFIEAYDSKKVKEDLATANEWLGNSIAFAAPYGEYNITTLDILRELNTKMAFTIEANYAKPSQHILEIPRYGIYPYLTMGDFISIIEKQNDYFYPNLKDGQKHTPFYPFYVH